LHLEARRLDSKTILNAVNMYLISWNQNKVKVSDVGQRSHDFPLENETNCYFHVVCKDFSILNIKQYFCGCLHVNHIRLGHWSSCSDSISFIVGLLNDNWLPCPKECNNKYCKIYFSIGAIHVYGHTARKKCHQQCCESVHRENKENATGCLLNSRKEYEWPKLLPWKPSQSLDVQEVTNTVIVIIVVIVQCIGLYKYIFHMSNMLVALSFYFAFILSFFVIFFRSLFLQSFLLFPSIIFSISPFL